MLAVFVNNKTYLKNQDHLFTLNYLAVCLTWLIYFKLNLYTAKFKKIQLESDMSISIKLQIIQN